MANRIFKQIISRVMAGVLTAVVCFSLLSNLPSEITAVSADTVVAVNSDNFPDANFRSYISEYIDTDHNNELSTAEIKATREIQVRKRNISTIKGIEYFTNLLGLD